MGQKNRGFVDISPRDYKRTPNKNVTPEEARHTPSIKKQPVDIELEVAKIAYKGIPRPTKIRRSYNGEMFIAVNAYICEMLDALRLQWNTNRNEVFRRLLNPFVYKFLAGLWDGKETIDITASFPTDPLAWKWHDSSRPEVTDEWKKHIKERQNTGKTIYQRSKRPNS